LILRLEKQPKEIAHGKGIGPQVAPRGFSTRIESGSLGKVPHDIGLQARSSLSLDLNSHLLLYGR
jgi:hypothetical protein